MFICNFTEHKNMLKKYFVLLVMSFSYLIHLLFRYMHYSVYRFFSNYFADILCLPLLLSFSLLLLRYLKKENNLWLNLRQIIFALIYTSILFEFIIPIYSSRYTSDFFDILAYSLGAFFFYIFQKKICPILRED